MVNKFSHLANSLKGKQQNAVLVGVFLRIWTENPKVKLSL